jgi:hypothetical protein
MGAALALRYVVDVQSEQGDAFTERELTGVIARVADRLFAQPTLAEIG